MSSAAMTVGTPLRILVTDDHSVVCSGLEALLSAIGRVAIARSGAEALRLCATFDPHVVLLDLWMPGLDGYATLSAIRQQWPHIHVIILTASDHLAEPALAQEHGAAGFIHKSESPAILLEALRIVVAGGTYFPKTVPLPPGTPQALTARELDVLRHLARGLTNSEIGQILGIAAQTVKGHLKSLFPKLQAANRAEAVARAHELGIL
jgi:DNA-binding NarL/FixJ family response regulator